MASNLRVDTILPSSGLNLGIGTANGTINFLGNSNLTTTGDVTIGGDLGVGGTVTYEDVARIDATGLSTFREGYKVGPLTGIALTAYKDGSIRTTGIITASSFVGDGSGLTGAGPTLANGSNDRVVTATGANGLTGESNLTFTGSILTVTNSSGASELTLVTPNNTDGGIYFNDGSNSGALSYLHTDNSMRFRVNAQTQLHIKSDHTLTNVAGTTKFGKNSVGIGTTTTTGRNAGVSTASGTFQFDETSQRLTVYNGKLGQWMNVQTDAITAKYNTNSLDVNRREFLVMEIIKSMNADNNLLFCYDANSTYAWHGGDSEVVDQSINGIYGVTSNVSWVEKSGDATGYYQFNANSGNTYINLGTRPGNELADTNSQYACCFWIYDADWSVLNDNQWWVLNDGDWSPTGQVGIRMVERGTDGELRIRAAIGTGGDNNVDKNTTGWPNSGWIFVGVIRSINQMTQNKYEMYQSYRGLPANTDIELLHNLSNMAGGEHNRWGDMMIGARPDDYANTKNKHGSRISSIAFWSRHDGYMIDGTSGANTTQIPNWFNTIFKKTRFMFQ